MLKSFFPRSTVFYYIAGSVVDALEDYGIAKFQKEEDEESREQGGAGEAEARPPRRPASNLCEDARRCLQDRTGRVGAVPEMSGFVL